MGTKLPTTSYAGEFIAIAAAITHLLQRTWRVRRLYAALPGIFAAGLLAYGQVQKPAIVRTVTGKITEINHSRAGIMIVIQGSDGTTYSFQPAAGQMTGATDRDLRVGDEVKVEFSSVTQNYPPIYGEPVRTILLRHAAPDQQTGDAGTTQKLIAGSWYCGTNPTHRFDFGGNGGFMWYSYIPLKGALRLWSANYTGPATYAVKSSTDVQIGVSSRLSDIAIQSISTSQIRFVWEKAAYSCTHTPPAGDTAESRAAAWTELTRQKQRFLGKWTAANGNEYVEFLPNDLCVRGRLQGGQWVATRDHSEIYHEGADASCGAGGLFSFQSPNVIVLDAGMGGDVISYIRNR
jgi:hypothetical protein